MESTKMDLKAQWEALKSQQPKIRTRNAAHELEVSEAELVAAHCGETGNFQVTRLTPDFEGILKSIASLGTVKALTRNEEVVHEKVGVYPEPEFAEGHKMGMFVSEDIDLRLFMHVWQSAFGVIDQVSDSPRYSIQFFAKDGKAIHKIYQTTKSNVEGFQSIIENFKHEDQEPVQSVEKPKRSKEPLPDSDIDKNALRNDWLNMNNTHDFFGLLQKHKATRIQALRLAPEGDYAIPVSNVALRDILQEAVQDDIPIMAFVGNEGLIQIHTGPVRKLFEYQDWYNVMDPQFNLHVNETGINQTWVVRKPTEKGIVTSLEFFNNNGELILTLFGKRKGGDSELENWKDAVKAVEKRNAHV